MLSGDEDYVEGLHFFEVESADDIRGRKGAKDRYFTEEADARSYFEHAMIVQKFVWLTEIGDCYEYEGKWRVYDWSPAVTASELYPYAPRGRCNGYIAEGHTEVDKEFRTLPRRYVPHDPKFKATK